MKRRKMNKTKVILNKKEEQVREWIQEEDARIKLLVV